RRPRERPVVHIYLTGLLNAALAVTAVAMVQTVPWGVVLVGLLTVSMAAVYSVYYGLLRDHRDLGVLNDLSLRVAGVGRGDDGQLEMPEFNEGAWSVASWFAPTGATSLEPAPLPRRYRRWPRPPRTRRRSHGRDTGPAKPCWKSSPNRPSR